MPDRETLIKGLRDIDMFIAGRLGYEKAKEFLRTIDEAIILLKEQEAKQIVRKQCKKEHEDGSIDYFAEWYCPHCNMLILRGFDNPSIKFCYKCGKPILWEGR